MRVTIDIPDEIHAKLKALAKREGTTMRAIILSGIDAVLSERRLLTEGELLRSGGGRVQKAAGRGFWFRGCRDWGLRHLANQPHDYCARSLI